ncbi:hypothetical protein [Micromonospora arborensis]|nr:hypothetical protein [Micromonospora arborensis]
MVLVIQPLTVQIKTIPKLMLGTAFSVSSAINLVVTVIMCR